MASNAKCFSLSPIVGSIGVHTDITDWKKADDALGASEERHRLLAENSTDMISRHAIDGHFLYASPAALSLLQYQPESLAGKALLDLIHPDDLPEATACYERILHPPFSLTFSYRIKRKDGVWVWFETTSRALRDSRTGEIHEIICVSRDVTDRRLVEAEFEYLAYHDGLTRLPNRVLFRDRLTVALAHCRRNHERLAVMFLDLDRFKIINDTLGHSMGDKLLERIAERLARALREQDTVARIGGDEFTILISDIENEEDAAKIARKILAVVAQPVELEDQSIHSTVSIGISVYPNDGDEAETLLRNADVAMYRAKELGRNNYQLCTPAMNRRAAERLTLEHSLHRALENGEFRLLYQPQVNVRTGAVTGVEALVRWHDPERGLISPAEFIPIAEEIQLIIPIGEWILGEATRQIGHWHRNGHPSLRLAVNLSPLQFQQRDLTTTVNRILRANRFDSHLLEFEITESTAMQNIDLTVSLLRRMREMGLTFSIDDFGTGHSSLNYLKRFPIDAIKIDQSFVRDVDTDRASAAIVAAIVSMAHGLDLRVIAEGVESKAQLDSLMAHGCEDMQGFYFCIPLSAEELGPVLEDFRVE